MEQKTPEFLKGIKKEIPEGKITLVQLKALVNSYKTFSNEIEKLEKELEIKKANLRKISEEDIPMLLQTSGLSEIKLDTGEKVTVKETQFVSITDEKAYFDFLKERGEDDIIKYNLKFAKMSSPMKQKLNDFLLLKTYDYVSDNKIHYNTTQKYFRALLGYNLPDDEKQNGLESGMIIPIDSIKNFAKVYNTFKTNIKK